MIDGTGETCQTQLHINTKRSNSNVNYLQVGLIMPPIYISLQKHIDAF